MLQVCGINYKNLHNLDIIPNKYEGGQTLWDCTIDFLNYLNTIDLQNKIIIDMGCGLGLLGIMSLKKQAQKVYFQDYNKETYELALKPQLELNFNKDNQLSYEFIYGDWKNINLEKVDIILASEIIYREENYQKVEDFIIRNMKQDGYCLMINKSYYFGVGGSTQAFKESLTKLKIIEEIVLNNKKGVKKVIQKLVFI